MRNGGLLLFGEFSLLCVLFGIFQILGVAGFEKPCNTSTSTVEFIKQCPTDQQKYIEAASRKNCAAIANTCESFEYHCVLNLWRNATLEVCAPSLIIVGQVCAEYSEGAMSVRATEESCQNFSKPCPPRYNSTVQYKYSGCYDVVNKVSPPNTTPVDTTLSTVHNTTTSSMSTVHNTTTSSTTPAMTTEKEGLSEGKSVGIALGVTVAVILILILIMAAIVFMYVRHKMKTQRKTFTEVVADLPFCCRRLAEGCTCIQTYMDKKYRPSTLQDSSQSTPKNQNSMVPEGISFESLPLSPNNETNTDEGITPNESSSSPLLPKSNSDNAQDNLCAHRTPFETTSDVGNQDICDARNRDHDENSSSQSSRSQNKSKDLQISASRNGELDSDSVNAMNQSSNLPLTTKSSKSQEPSSALPADISSSSIQQSHSSSVSSTNQQFCHVQPLNLSTHQHTENASSISTSNSENIQLTENATSDTQPTNPPHTENASSGIQPTNPPPTENASSHTQPTNPPPTENASSHTQPTNPTPTENAPSGTQQPNPTPTENASSHTQQTNPTPTENASSHTQPTNPTPTENASSHTQPTNPTPTENAPSHIQQPNPNRRHAHPESPDGPSTHAISGAPLAQPQNINPIKFRNRITLERDDTPVKSAPKDVENGALNNRSNEGMIELDGSGIPEVNEVIEPGSSTRPINDSDSGTSTGDASKNDMSEMWKEMKCSMDEMKTYLLLVTEWFQKATENHQNALKQIQEQNEKLREKDQEILDLHLELEKKNTELEKKNTELEKKNTDLEKKNTELEKKNTELERKNVALERTKLELERTKMELEKKNEIDEKEKQIAELKEQIALTSEERDSIKRNRDSQQQKICQLEKEKQNWEKEKLKLEGDLARRQKH